MGAKKPSGSIACGGFSCYNVCNIPLGGSVMEKFAVTINYRANYGYIEYDPETKTADIHFPLADKKAEVDAYLHQEHTFSIQSGETIRDFKKVTLNPLSDLTSFQLCLTRMWEATDVRVEWSMPPGMAETLQ